jgi:hypothetical protein
MFSSRYSSREIHRDQRSEGTTLICDVSSQILSLPSDSSLGDLSDFTCGFKPQVLVVLQNVILSGISSFPRLSIVCTVLVQIISHPLRYAIRPRSASSKSEEFVMKVLCCAEAT